MNTNQIQKQTEIIEEFFEIEDVEDYCDTVESMFICALKDSRNIDNLQKHYLNVDQIKKFLNQLYECISSGPVPQPAPKASAPIADTDKATGYEEAINEFFDYHGNAPIDIETIETTLDSLLINALQSQDHDGACFTADFAILVNGLRRLIRALGAGKN